jgi:parallel beta-helix repeat protein
MRRHLFDRVGWAAAGALGIALIAVVAGVVRAGPLDPPNAPGSTTGVLRPGTPITALPSVISQPGNYYLTGNLTMATAGTGITINASNVTLDLGGFTIDGAHQGGTGVLIPSQFNGFNLHAITVRNGNAINWTQTGFDLQWVDTLVAENLIASNNNQGIIVSNGRLADCGAYGNTTYGVRSQGGATISGCTAKNNQDTGFLLTNTSILESCTAVGNHVGIDVRSSTVDGCNVVGALYGINVGYNCNIRNNTVQETDSDGIRVASPSGSGESLITENTVEDAGVNVGASGIYVQTSNNVISRNHVTFTNGPGINVVGSFNTVDENTTLSNDGVGITVAGSKNTVVHNTSLGNVNQSASTNYSVGVGNNYGGVTAAASGANPWSNTQ